MRGKNNTRKVYVSITCTDIAC